MVSVAPLLCLAPALLLTLHLHAGAARADSSDELQVDGKLDAVDLGGEAAHKETVEGLIKDLTPAIDAGRLSETQLIRALALRCWAYYEKGLFDAAIADCNRVLASRPDHGTALLVRASASIRLGRFAAAVGDLDHAIADGGLAKDDLGLAYLRRAIAREAMGDGKDATEDVKQAVALDPRLMDVYREINTAMLAHDKAGSAIATVDEAMALDPKSAQSYLDRGVARMARGQLDGAIADFDKALEIDPYMAAAFQHRGDARFHHGLDLQAIEDFDRALDLDAHVAPVLKARALAEFDLGRFEAAAHDLAASVKADGTDPYAVLWLYIAQRRIAPADVESSVALMKRMSALAATAWPAPVLRFYAGQSTQDTLRAGAGTGDARQRPRQLCDAAFYAGEQALIARDAKGAATLLREAATACPALTAESVLAKTELARLAN